MPILKIENFSFRYPNESEFVLNGINLSVNRGETVFLFGESGSGKTTLLSNIKREIAPKGTASGNIFFGGKNINDGIPSSEIGFVAQSPENQIVADTVFRELAFGLENTLTDSKLINRRIAETACYFGIDDILGKKTAELSGGQKQLLNLASCLCLNPSFVILDEPLSQLDPVSAEKFLHELFRINSELGITVILSEHFTENILPYCTRAVYLEKGKIIFDGNNSDFVKFVMEKRSIFSPAMPAASRLAFKAGQRDDLPLSVNDGINNAYIQSQKRGETADRGFLPAQPVLKAENIVFSYDKKSNLILKGADIELYAGEIRAVVGGNAQGKSTLLKVLSGCKKQDKGKIKKSNAGRTVLLPQEPRLLFCKDSVYRELEELSERFNYSKDDILNIIDKFKLNGLENRHPYDLSCGEIQKLALAKLLLTSPQILFLDEPVKGLDAPAKADIANMMRTLAEEGKTIAFVTHDLDFAAGIADTVTMISQGKTVCTEKTEKFFSENRFYTTAENRITGGIKSAFRAEEERL